MESATSKITICLKWLILIGSVCLGIFIVFSNVFHCEFAGDEGYQALSVKNYKDAPLALLLFFNGHVWTQIFGFSMLSLRILTRICFITAISIGCIYEWWKTKNIYLTAITFLICSLIANLSGFGIYNWDTGAYPIEALWSVCMISYCCGPKRYKLIILSVLSGVLTATRLPLASSVAIVIFAILMFGKGRDMKEKITDIAISVIVPIAVYVCIGIAIEGNFGNFVAAFNSDNVITGHGVSAIDNYLWRMKLLLPFVLLSWVPVICCFIFAENFDFKYRKRYTAIAVLTCITAGWCVLRVSAIHEGYDHPIFGLGTPLLIVITLFIPFYNILNIRGLGGFDRQTKKICIILIAAMLMVGLGSDATFERWMVISLFPISVGVIYKSFSETGYDRFIIWMVLVLVMLMPMWAFKFVKSPQYYVEPEREIVSRGDLPLYYDMEGIFNEIPKDVEYMDSLGKRYTFWGFHRYPLVLEFEAEPAYSFQTYHYQKLDITKTVKDIDRLDYVFLTYGVSETEIEDNERNLEKAGFKLAKRGTNYVLMEK